MISETWVWIYLPRQLSPTLAGVLRHDGAAGRFVYGKSYLARTDALPIDPIALPLTEKECVTRHFQGWFSALLDSGPDAWGQRLIARSFGVQDTRGYLLHAYGQPVGALAFTGARDTSPETNTPAPIQTLAHTLELHSKLESGETLSPDESRQLLDQAGSGGARPKLTVEHDGALWLVKGVSVNDNPDLAPVPSVEAALLSLAAELDIQAPQAQVQIINGKPALLVRRFDRTAVAGGFSRWRYASGQTLLWSEPEVAKWSFQGSYINLAHRLFKWEASPQRDAQELYRRLVFNALCGNLDDHEKNHGVVAGADGNFRLSPVFDITITATSAKRQMLAMAFGSEGATISRENLLSDCAQFGYTTRQADEIIRRHWDHLSRHALERLVSFGCDEARAARTLALMPGHRVLPDEGSPTPSPRTS